MHDVEPWLDSCLASIVTSAPEGTEVVLVDDGSTDGRRDLRPVCRGSPRVAGDPPAQRRAGSGAERGDGQRGLCRLRRRRRPPAPGVLGAAPAAWSEGADVATGAVQRTGWQPRVAVGPAQPSTRPGRGDGVPARRRVADLRHDRMEQGLPPLDPAAARSPLPRGRPLRGPAGHGPGSTSRARFPVSTSRSTAGGPGRRAARSPSAATARQPRRPVRRRARRRQLPRRAPAGRPPRGARP